MGRSAHPLPLPVLTVSAVGAPAMAAEPGVGASEAAVLPALPAPESGGRLACCRGVFSSLLLHAALVILALAAPLTGGGPQPVPLLRVTLVSLLPGPAVSMPAAPAAPTAAAPAPPSTLSAAEAAALAPKAVTPSPVPRKNAALAPRPRAPAWPASVRPTPVKPNPARPAAAGSAPVAASPAKAAADAPATALGAGTPGPTPGAAQGEIRGEALYTPSQLDRPPAVTRPVRPHYPDSARSRRLEGRVVVRLVVESSGLPGPCDVHAANPRGYFEDAALEAAQRTRFRPGSKDGRAVRTVVLLPFDFRLQ